MLHCTTTRLARRAVHALLLSRCPAQPPLWRSSCSMSERGPAQRIVAAAGGGGNGGGAATADLSVAETVRLLEAGTGPLSTQPMTPAPEPRVFVISGPSGVGKDAVLKRLQQRRPDLYFVVTATSRPMRPGEVEGIDYFFVDKGTFEGWVSAGQLLEHALVYGEYKGIPRGQVDEALARGADVVLRIDVQGAATVRQLLPGVVGVFLVAESEAQLVQRLAARKTEPMDKLRTRVQTAREETQRINEFDYVVVNKDGQLDACVDHLCAIIDAERLRTRVGGSSRGTEGQQQQQQQQSPLPA